MNLDFKTLGMLMGIVNSQKFVKKAVLFERLTVELESKD